MLSWYTTLPTHAQPLLYRIEASPLRASYRQVHDFGSALVLVVVADHGLVVHHPQSAVWPPSTFTNDACPCPQLCTSTVCARMHSSLVPALVSGDRFS